MVANPIKVFIVWVHCWSCASICVQHWHRVCKSVHTLTELGICYKAFQTRFILPSHAHKPHLAFICLTAHCFCYIKRIRRGAHSCPLWYCSGRSQQIRRCIWRLWWHAVGKARHRCRSTRGQWRADAHPRKWPHCLSLIVIVCVVPCSSHRTRHQLSIAIIRHGKLVSPSKVLQRIS